MEKSGTIAKKILVVEDEPAVSKVCRRALASEGFEVDIAADGSIAQDMVEKKQYDFCLIDIKTPEMDVKELLQWLKEKHPSLMGRVILTTGRVMAQGTQILLE